MKVPSPSATQEEKPQDSLINSVFRNGQRGCSETDGGEMRQCVVVFAQYPKVILCVCVHQASECINFLRCHSLE